MHPARTPNATYRVQFSKDFTFDDAAAITEYLRDLGVSDLYASPIFAARPGSPHGYDVTDPTTVNPELGGRERLGSLAASLRSLGMGLLLDIVPNHMATHASNRWWWDVLKRGRSSDFAALFDIAWDEQGRVLLPVLGEPLAELIRQGQVRIAEQDGEHTVRIGDLLLPLAPDTAPSQQPTDDARTLTAMLDRQAYRLAFWREGVREINYRRFFDITDLIGVKVEDDRTLEATHRLIFELLAAGLATGVRIDHIDGLHDPGAYLAKLRDHAAARLARSPYVVVEKILGEHESLPDSWPCDGTTGYEVAVALNRLFVDPAGFAAIERHGRAACGWPATFGDSVWQSKQEVLRTLFVAEVQAAAKALGGIAATLGRATAYEDLRRALVDVTAALPVYRTYIRGPHVEPRDRGYIEAALAEAARRRSGEDEPLALIRDVLLLSVPDSARDDALRFVMRWQQLSGPATAKGVEDTALYRYTPLVSLNEVGGEPVPRGDAVAEFHRLNAGRAERWPGSLSATSTHDTKRSEDVRARISVLSEIAGEWTASLDAWRTLNAPLRRAADGGEAPSPVDEFLLYQTLLGAWPLDGNADAAFIERIQQYMLKAMREAKVRTSWLDPDDAYEAAVRAFIDAALDPDRSRQFLDELRTLEARTAFHGMLNALAQTLLKLAAPGVPDIYRGTELWDLSLVDPDNRRPVDFSVRRDALTHIQRGAKDRVTSAGTLLASWQDGRIKLAITQAALRLRRRLPGPFAGEYTPLEAAGPRAAHLVAFARHRSDEWVIAVAPRLTVSLAPAGAPPLGRAVWADTCIQLPNRAPKTWRDELTGRAIAVGPHAQTLSVGDTLATLPVALLVAEPAPHA